MEFEKEPKKASNKPQVGSRSFTIIMTACITFALTILMVYYANGGIVFLPVSQYGDMDKALIIAEIAADIENQFYGEIPDNDALYSAAANGMVESLNDPYARYFTQEEFEEYYKSLGGTYNGIGVVVSVPDENGSVINSVYEKSPAAEAGILSGDIITHVNGEDIRNYSSDTFNALLVGKDGEVITLSITRDGKNMDIKVTIGEVSVTNVHYQIYDNTGYILIDMFSENSSDEFTEALDYLQNKKVDALIIDLRNNPGGSLNAVVAIADSILDSGKIVSVGRSTEDTDIAVYEAEKGGIALPIAVLVNKNSASASEILAAALSENNAAIIIGETTYGKGIVQTTLPLSGGKAWLKLTTDAYFTPNGNNIHGIGVSPDIKSTLPAEFANTNIIDIPPDMDTQLSDALSELYKLKNKG